MRLVVIEFMTVDGVMEAPGFEEHRTGRNGWAMEVTDAELGDFNAQQIDGAAALLFGRTTFNIWAAFWPTAPDAAAEIGRRITGLPKYVVSKTLRHSDWANTRILRGDLEEEIRRLKEEPGGNLRDSGSADLVDGLLALDLVDELSIRLFPILLGSGKRLFRDEAQLRRLRLLSTETSSGGVVYLRYERSTSDGAKAEDTAPYLWTGEQYETFHAMEDTNRVLATVLFTDIVDWTGRAAALGDREWRLLLDRKDDAARAEVKRWGGQLVKSTGDGVLARFETPTRALRCAFGLCSSARRLGLQLRAAIHTGEIEVRGDDIGGIGVNIAARVLASAGDGEVIITRTVRELATGTDLAFEPRGEVELRGVPGRWELYAASIR
jgi:class 3 adenylate cyclase/dihydrofolate reductase